MGFLILVWFVNGREKGIEFITAYLIEYSLSVDNMFVFLALFTYFAVPREAQRKVLLWGILGAIFSRGIFIFARIALVERFHFLLYVLGVVLLYTAYHPHQLSLVLLKWPYAHTMHDGQHHRGCHN